MMDTALHELTDNSFEHGANFIEIRFSIQNQDELYQIQHMDNGNGIDDLRTVFCIGYTRKRDRGGCGRYGIGMKNAVVVLGDMIHFKTVYKGRSKTCEYDVVKLSRQDEYLPTTNPETVTEEPSSTRITINRICATYQQFQKARFETIVRSYAHRYWKMIKPHQSIRFVLDGDERLCHVFTHHSVTDKASCPLHPSWMEVTPFELRQYAWLEKYYSLSDSMGIDVWKRRVGKGQEYVFTTIEKKYNARVQFDLQERPNGNTTTLEKVTETSQTDLEANYDQVGRIRFETYGALPDLTDDEETHISSLTHKLGQGGLVYVFRNSHCITSIKGVRYKPLPGDGYSNRIVHHLSYEEYALDTLIGTSTEKQNSGQVSSTELAHILIFVSQAHERPLRRREKRLVPPKPVDSVPPPVIESNDPETSLIPDTSVIPNDPETSSIPDTSGELSPYPSAHQVSMGSDPSMLAEPELVDSVSSMTPLQSAMSGSDMSTGSSVDPQPFILPIPKAQPEHRPVPLDVPEASSTPMEPNPSVAPVSSVKPEPSVAPKSFVASQPCVEFEPQTERIEPVLIQTDNVPYPRTGSLHVTPAETLSNIESVQLDTDDDEYASLSEDDVDSIQDTTPHAIPSAVTPNDALSTDSQHVEQQRQQLQTAVDEHSETVKCFTAQFHEKQAELQSIQVQLDAAIEKKHLAETKRDEFVKLYLHM